MQVEHNKIFNVSFQNSKIQLELGHPPSALVVSLTARGAGGSRHILIGRLSS